MIFTFPLLLHSLEEYIILSSYVCVAVLSTNICERENVPHGTRKCPYNRNGILFIRDLRIVSRNGSRKKTQRQSRTSLANSQRSMHAGHFRALLLDATCVEERRSYYSCINSVEVSLNTVMK